MQKPDTELQIHQKELVSLTKIEINEFIHSI